MSDEEAETLRPAPPLPDYITDHGVQVREGEWFTKEECALLERFIEKGGPLNTFKRLSDERDHERAIQLYARAYVWEPPA